MRRVVQYLGVGAVAATVDIALFTLFVRQLGYDYFVVGIVTFVLATAVNYALCVRYVFESGVRFERAHEIALVFGVSAVGLAINQAVLYVAIGRLAADPLLGKVVATGVVFGWNYLARSRFVFRGSA